jgi:hypothetical protein
MPPNLALSLVQIIGKLLIEIVPPTKDFLVALLLDLLRTIVDKVGALP